MIFGELQIGEAFSMSDGKSVGIKTAAEGAFYFGSPQVGNNWWTWPRTEVVRLNLSITDEAGKVVAERPINKVSGG
jgi:hypothetical protein